MGEAYGIHAPFALPKMQKAHMVQKNRQIKCFFNTARQSKLLTSGIIYVKMKTTELRGLLDSVKSELGAL